MLSPSSRLLARRPEARYRFMYPTDVTVPGRPTAVSADRHCVAERPTGLSEKSRPPALLGVGHRGVECERALDAFGGRRFDSLEQRPLVSGPPLEPRRQMGGRFGFDDVHALAPDADRDFPDEAVVAQAVDDHAATAI